MSRAFPGEVFERLLRRAAWHGPLLRILIGQLVQREAATRRDLQCPGERLRVAAEQPRHLLRRLQITVGMTLAAEPGLVDGAIVPDAGHDILKNAARRDMEENVVGDDSRHSACKAMFDSSYSLSASFGRRRSVSAI